VLVSYRLNSPQWPPIAAGKYCQATVELDEQAGLRLKTVLVNFDADQPRAGMPVTVTFQRLGDIWLPWFEPRAASLLRPPRAPD
jgi:uncharacterized protein